MTLDEAKAHARAVDDAVRALNEVVAAAASDGMFVEAEILPLTSIGKGSAPFLSMSAKVAPDILRIPESEGQE